MKRCPNARLSTSAGRRHRIGSRTALVKILSLVWNYASDADTHTVETHIYRLRKKIAEKFSDEKFILNSKEGYYL